MNPLDFAARVLRDVYTGTAGDALAATDPEPAPASPADVAARVCRVPEPMYVTGFEPGFRARAADEALVLESLAVETARVGPWEAARSLFAPNPEGRT